MNDRAEAEALRLRMQKLRAELGHNVHETMETARTMLDWRHYVRKHPWICLAAAAAAGFALVPKRSKYVRPDPEVLAELAKRHRLVVAAPSAALVRGGVGGALLSMTANALAKGAMNYLAQHVDHFVRSRSRQEVIS